MAKKSMIEREKKRIKLNNKYADKRALLLNEYKTTEDFNMKLEIHFKIQKLPRNSAKSGFEIDVGKQVDHVVIIVILVFRDMY